MAENIILAVKKADYFLHQLGTNCQDQSRSNVESITTDDDIQWYQPQGNYCILIREKSTEIPRRWRRRHGCWSRISTLLGIL